MPFLLMFVLIIFIVVAFHADGGFDPKEVDAFIEQGTSHRPIGNAFSRRGSPGAKGIGERQAISSKTRSIMTSVFIIGIVMFGIVIVVMEASKPSTAKGRSVIGTSAHDGGGGVDSGANTGSSDGDEGGGESEGSGGDGGDGGGGGE